MTEKILTQKRLKELLNYDLDSGVFTRKIKTSNRLKDGLPVGSLNHGGYLLISVDAKQYRAHRLAWLYVYGEWPKKSIDHIDGNKINNKINNLREATIQQNAQNIRKANSNNKSGYLGVCFHKLSKLFKAEITHNGKCTCLGYFKSPELAHQAYLAKKRELHKFSTI